MLEDRMQDSVQAHLRSFGAAIRGERRRLNLSQEDFAEICELHRTYIGQVERGEKEHLFREHHENRALARPKAF